MKLYRFDKMPGYTSRDTDRLLLTACKDYLHEIGVSPEKTPKCVLRSALGKPFLPEGLPNVGVTHTDSEVWIAFAPYPFGIDCESRIRPVRHIEALSKRYYTENERALIACQPEVEQKREAFLHLWVKKEAYVKAFGLGLHTMKAFDTEQVKGTYKDLSTEGNILYVYIPTAQEEADNVSAAKTEVTDL